METKANHVLIGGATLVFLVAALGFVWWLAGQNLDRTQTRYRIYFEGAVDGLGVGGDVRFNGLRVGVVDHLRIDPEDPRRVEAIVSIGADTPVRHDSVAELALQGITGVSFIQISAGSAQSARLEPKAGDDLPVIRSRPSRLQEVVQGAPQLLANGNELVQNLNDLVDAENREALNATLRNLEQITTKLNAGTSRLDGVIDQLGATSRQLDALARQGTTTLASVDAFVNGDAKGLVADSRASIQAVGRLATDVNSIVADHRGQLGDFAGDGLQQFARLMGESRQLVAALERIASRLETDPARFFLGTQRPEFDAR